MTFNSTLVKSVFPKLSKNVEVDVEIETYVTLANELPINLPHQSTNKKAIDSRLVENLFAVASWALFMPTNSADAERCISKYNEIFSDKR